jgi:CubicO group peptidase (beta-lactamase class C family)
MTPSMPRSSAGEIPGGVLLAGTDREIVHLKAFGNLAVEPKKIPMLADTAFDLASLSKSVGCATSIMVLVDQGKIDVHDRVSKYIPEFGANGKEEITIEQLLLHFSGMVPDNPLKDYEAGVEQAWKNLFALKPTTQPGTKFVYSDVNFEVLGELVHRVSGQPLDQFAKQRVFEPLGMKDTTYNPPQALRDRCAYCEKRGDKWMIGEVHDPRAFCLGGVAGHAGVFSTAQDVARWCQMLLNGGELDGHRILKAETVREMLTASPAAQRERLARVSASISTPPFPHPSAATASSAARRSATPVTPARASGSIRKTNASSCC